MNSNNFPGLVEAVGDFKVFLAGSGVPCLIQIFQSAEHAEQILAQVHRVFFGASIPGPDEDPQQMCVRQGIASIFDQSFTWAPIFRSVLYRRLVFSWHDNTSDFRFSAVP